MCNLSDLVNGWPGGCIVSKDGHAFGTATYHVMSMYSGSRLKEVLDIDVSRQPTVRLSRLEI